VVDDDPDVLRTFMRLFKARADVEVVLSADGAVVALERGGFDVVVVDFNMAGPSGAWLLRQVRDRYPKIRRFLLSGTSYAELSEYLDPGLVDHFLAKPLEIDQLLETVLASPVSESKA